MSGVPELIEQNYYEASARDRIAGLLDPASFHEFLREKARDIAKTEWERSELLAGEARHLFLDEDDEGGGPDG